MKYISNIFEIENLNKLSSQYRVYDIKGLRKGKDYQANKQFLIEKFSRIFHHPVLIIELNNEPKLIVRNNQDILSKIQTEYDFGRIYLHLYLTDKVFDIDFLNPSPEVKKICLRFLQFDINGQLKNLPDLWQPRTGDPFFLKQSESLGECAIYSGFTFRIIDTQPNGFGIVIDATRKISSRKPLDPYITREQFAAYYKKGRGKKSFIYRYTDWYEIQPTECDDFNVSQFKVNGISLIEHIRNVMPRPHSYELANLPKDSAVLTYYSGNIETRGAPAGLLYEVYDFQDTNLPVINQKVIITPSERFHEIKEYSRKYFNRLKFEGIPLSISGKMKEIPKKMFSYPSFELGRNFVLRSSQFSNPKEIADQRMKKICDPAIGYYTHSVLPDQLFVFPRSIYDMVGEQFINQLKQTMSNLYPSDTYNPTIVCYEDKFKADTDYLTIGRRIVDSVLNEFPRLGSGVVMIPRLEKKGKREHDKLAALIIRELKDSHITCSIIHKDVITQSFVHKISKDGTSYYEIREGEKGRYQRKYNGYLRNIAICKILLNSNKWPFVLNEPLSADLIIGIDVKHNTAGFIIIDKSGKNIRTCLEKSQNKEKLASDQIEARIYDIVSEELRIDPSTIIKNIVIHRDGRVFDTELEGINNALKRLKNEGSIAQDGDISIVEIPKSSLISFRVFSVDTNNGVTVIDNPPNGLVYYLSNEAFICTTGKEFRHDGTSNPLNIKFTTNSISYEELASDLYKLTTLAYTKPDDCSRYPITTKINDLRLFDAASEYDIESFKYTDILNDKSRSNYE